MPGIDYDSARNVHNYAVTVSQAVSAAMSQVYFIFIFISAAYENQA